MKLWSSSLDDFLQTLLTASLNSKYSPQHPVHKHTLSLFLSRARDGVQIFGITPSAISTEIAYVVT
jgi:hypothetical protein